MRPLRYCDGVTRRDVLQIGALGTLGLSLSGYLRLAEAGEVRPATARSGAQI